MSLKFIEQNKIDLLIQFVKTNFKMRYQNSLLGVLWVLIKPYITFAVLFFIFANFRGGSIEHYPLYLLTGIVFYTFFNELIVQGQMALLENAHIILKVNFPRQIVVLSTLIGALINLAINFILIIIIALISNADLTLSGLIYVFLVVLLIMMFSLGISFFTSIYTIRFRDLKYIFELGFFLLYWATPIFYVLEKDLTGGRTKDLISLNPLGYVINQIRAGIGIYGEINLQTTLIFLLISFIVMIVGWLFFQKEVKFIAEKF